MKEIEVKVNGYKEAYVDEFRSISDFNDYICNTPICEAFRWEKLSSSETDKLTQQFTGTSSYEEASELLKTGWDEVGKKLTHKLKVEDTKQIDMLVKKTVFDVVGFQCSVPRYLQGIPTNMVNKRPVVQKQKVITINKNISYSAFCSKETIIENSVKCLQLIRAIEAKGIRVNLNVVLGVKSSHKEKSTVTIAKVRVKNANERLNISKLSFVLCHPSMLRRLFFRFIEVSPHSHKGHTDGYGTPVDGETMSNLFKDEITLPRIFSSDSETITSLSKLVSLTDEKALFDIVKANAKNK